MLVRIKASMNSRQLCPMRDNLSDINPLTPGHFLIRSAILSPPEPDFSLESINYAYRRRKLKILHHLFARRWKDEYLVELHKRNKWKSPQRDFVVDDFMVIRHYNLPPNEWKLGRISRVYDYI